MFFVFMFCEMNDLFVRLFLVFVIWGIDVLLVVVDVYKKGDLLSFI